ncbi:hypothetical protein N868_03745 [Cellulomonas carbonis T26]|uniref:Uncharacterized protein n=1 Tax=Cellulomonas carbonis T26 TaxID=947969 RepID=A0A0A0BQ95_9CELL|nr:hypothetical protein N868_03745 [Cellulomonas carbonis T26]
MGAAIGVLGVTACGPDGGRPVPPGVAEQDADADPQGLVGLWRVERPGGSDAEWLRLDASELQLWSDGDVVLGSWTAGGSLLVASVDGWIGDADPEDAGWLGAVVGYRGTGSGWELVDVDGAVVATLRVDGAPDPHPDVTDEWTRPPEVTDRTREVLASPAPLPPALSPPTREDLTGRWVADAPVADDEPHVDLAGDGTYTGSDGCNGAAGRWALGAEGRFLATSGPMTAIGCDGAPVPSWVATARRVGMDGGALVLLDADGEELGRLSRSD